MTGWFVLGGILLLFFLVSRLRVGGFAEYSESGLLAKLKIGPVYITLYPGKPKPEKEKKAKREKKEPPPEEPVSKPGGGWAQFKRFLPLVTDAAGRLRKKIRIDRLYLDYTAAAADPAQAAMEYGYANAAVGMILPLFEHHFNVKERRIRTAVDFRSATPTVYVFAALSLTIGQAAALGVRLMIKLLKITSETKA